MNIHHLWQEWFTEHRKMVDHMDTVQIAITFGGFAAASETDALRAENERLRVKNERLRDSGQPDK